MNATAIDKRVNICGKYKEILNARKALGWSRQVAARYLGVSEQTICRWENGSTKDISAENYSKLESILDGSAKFDDDK